jgi:hypothetical protein
MFVMTAILEREIETLECSCEIRRGEVPAEIFEMSFRGTIQRELEHGKYDR